ncbi:RES family NAD+ phosphorylase, partial [Glaciimonas sp. GG7]
LIIMLDDVGFAHANTVGGWMPIVDVSDIQTITMSGWRAVEGQHLIATMVLADSIDEQHLLETILETSKPPIPPEAASLHWLLFTPFRYPPLPTGSRFRAPYDPGVFYATDEQRTACAELGYWRWRFLMDSELETIEPLQQTLFQSAIKGSSIDLRLAPYVAERGKWTHSTDYAACQAIGRAARLHAIEMVRYESVRDPAASGCVAVLSPGGFSELKPIKHETWNLYVTRTKVIWREESIFYAKSFEFGMG